MEQVYHVLMKLAYLVSVALAGTLLSAPLAHCENTDENSQALPVPNGPMVFSGYPDAFALGYRVHPDSISPDGKYGVLYCASPDIVSDPLRLANYLVTLKPLQIVAVLEGDVYFAHRNRSDLSVVWTDDSTMGLVTVDSRWGPGSVDLIQIADGKLVRQTNLLERTVALLKPDWQSCKCEPYNENFSFVISSDTEAGWTFDTNNQVRVDCIGETNPKHLPNEKSWEARFEGIWDIKESRFIKTKVTRLHCGDYKEEQ